MKVSPLTLCLVTDEVALKGRPLLDVVKAAVNGGVTLVQLREKNLNTRAFIDRAIKLKAYLDTVQIPLIINDRVDIALAISANGVHVGQSDMPVSLVKKIAPPDMIVGLSIETLSQAEQAESLHVSYYGVGPIYPTPTKQDAALALGIDGLKILRAQSHKFLMAIGGVNQENVGAVIRAGADGVAVVSAICSAKDPEKAAIVIRSQIDQELQNR